MNGNQIMFNARKFPMASILSALTFAAALSAPVGSQAQVSIKEPWVRATVPQQRATGAFMRIESAKDTRLVSASSPVTAVVEVHEMSMENNVMRMREIAAVDVPAGAGVELKPGGYHVMLMNLPRQIREGELVPLTLIFEDRDGTRRSVQISAPVRALTAPAGGTPSPHR